MTAVWWRVGLLLGFLAVCAPSTATRAQGHDFAAEYARLSRLVEEREPEPRGSPKQLEPYLTWMETKAGDRDEIATLLQQANELSNADPDDDELAAWTQKLFELHERAQASGDLTVWNAALMFLRWGAGTRNDQWPSAISELNDKGRRLYLKAQETGFDTHEVREKARCMIRFSTADIEFGDLAIWWGRESVHGHFDDEGYLHTPDEPFEVECTQRADGSVIAEGEPAFPTDEALEDTKKIRDEAEWWAFEPERKDVVDLENTYYEDALCEQPPHKDKMGHDWFKEVAEEHELDESVEHNEGFYGTLFGTVRVRMPDGDEPASGARVTVKSGGESWTATADGEGNYEIADVILHESCSPHDISATYEGDRVDDTYDGPLEEPDRGARHRKDLLIIPTAEYDWTGTLTLGNLSEQHCEAQDDEGPGSRSYANHETHAQRVVLQIYGRDIRETGAGFDIRMGRDLNVTGSMRARITNSGYYHTQSESGSRQTVESRTLKGTSSHDVGADNLTLHVSRSMPSMNPEAMEALARELQSGSVSPERLQEIQRQMAGLTSTSDDGYDVQVVVQVAGNWRLTALFTDYRAIIDDEGSDVQRDDSGTREIPLTPLRAILEGRYTKGKDGTATLTATVSRTDPSPAGGVWDCPDAMGTVDGTLTLRRTKRRPEGR